MAIDKIHRHNKSHSRWRNHTNKQYQALIVLSYNEEIIIKKVDKASNVVIQNRNDHSEEGLETIKEL